MQSHWFSVGPLCAWARAGVGAVATQSVVEPAYGPNALDRLADGIPAPQALGELLAADPLAAVRQVAVIDNAGHLSAHTGADCIAHAGHVKGGDHSCQANMMARDTVPGAMSAAFKQATGLLPDRLLAALEAAEAEGGDIRGRQSAAMLVVPRRGRTVAADGGPPRGGLARPAEGAQTAPHPAARLRSRGRGGRAARRGPHRRGRRALHPSGGARPGLGRAAVLGRPRPRPGRRPGRRRGGGEESRGGQPGLVDPPGAALTRIRSGGRSGASALSRSPERGTSHASARASAWRRRCPS